MSERKQRLLKELSDKEYREMYAEKHVNAILAAQISAIREQRGLTQSGLAERIGKQQPAISRIENVNYARWNIATLRQVANALGCWLDIRLENWGHLVEEADSYSMETLRRERIEDDPIFFGSEALGIVQEPVRWMQKRLLPWLASQDNNEKLVRWLRGYDLPPVGDAEPPFVWIGRAVDVEPADSKFRSLLIDRVLSLLGEIQEGRAQTGEANPLPVGIFNLLAAFPSVKGWEKLKELYSDGLLAQMMLPAPVQTAFLSALICNQMNREFEEVWFEIIRTGGHPWLPANEFDAFEGLKWLAPRPRLGGIAAGLQELFIAKCNRQGLGINFIDLMEDLKHAFQKDDPLLGERLLKESVKAEWDSEIVRAWREVFAKDQADIIRLIEGAEKKERPQIEEIVGAL